MKELLEVIARHLVNDPDAVNVTELKTEAMSVFEVRVAYEDMGRMIGKGGGTLEAIRAVLSAVAARANRRAMVEIVEPRSER
jgi:predicted RNA-binding protein YlqC (UPF0109 family)